MSVYNTKFGIKVSVEIIRDIEDDTARVRVICPIYKSKEFLMDHCYKSSCFTDYQILKDSDFLRVMCSHFPN